MTYQKMMKKYIKFKKSTARTKRFSLRKMQYRPQICQKVPIENFNVGRLNKMTKPKSGDEFAHFFPALKTGNKGVEF